VKAIRVVVSNQDHKDFRGNPIATDSSFRGEKRRESKRARNCVSRLRARGSEKNVRGEGD
jgi:hypothetical protein